MKYTILVGSRDEILVCFKDESSIVVRGIARIEELIGFININNALQNVIIRAYHSFEDIAGILKDYEHNN